MAAGSAAERAEAKGRASARKRGREVCLPVSHLVLSFTLSFLLPSQFVLVVHAAMCFGPRITSACCCTLRVHQTNPVLHVHLTMLAHSNQNGVAVMATTHELPSL